MAKIDSVGRMRLPPDSGIRTQAHSRREHAASEPVKQAMTEWFQTIQGARREASDEALNQAIKNALTDRVNRGEATPKVLPLQILTKLPADGSERHLYQVQLGQSLLTLSSKVPLQPGQTLVVTPGKTGPVVINPVQTEHQLLVRALSQQQQLHWLPAPQGRTPLSALIPWMVNNVTPTDRTEGALQPGVQRNDSVTVTTSALTNTAHASGANRTTGSTLPTASWLVQALQQVLSQWQNSMASTASVRTGYTSGPISTGDSALAVTNSGAAATPVSGNIAGASIQVSDHWIPQLIRSATQQFGEATPQTVRQVFEGWQQAALNQARALPLPDLSQVHLRPVTTNTNNTMPPPPLLSAPHLSGSANTTVLQPPTLNHGSVATETTSQTGDQQPKQPPTLADLVPVLKGLGMQPDRDGNNADRIQPRVPTDLWRLAAEQMIDLRLQQLGHTPQHSLQEALQRRAEQLLRQVTTTYSPAQLKQQFQRGAAQGGAQTSGGNQTTEQQVLLQVRQLLEQVSQQQQVRTLMAPQPDNPNDTPRQLQGIPLLADQQLIWFDLERQPPEQASEQQQEHQREWVLDLHFQLPPMAPVCARLRWQTDHARLEMLTDDTPTLRLLHSHLQGLQERLKGLQLPVEDVQVRHGIPKRDGKTGTVNSGNDSSPGHIDIKT